MKKSQMEIIGLAVIVILITLGMLFVIQFSLFTPQQEIKKTFTQTQTAANTLTTLLRTTTDCLDASVMELLQNCAEHTEDESNRIQCNEGNSCDKSESLIEDILEKSLSNYGIKNYEFRILDQDYYQPIGPIKQGSCLQSKESKQAYFQAGTGIITIYMDIC